MFIHILTVPAAAVLERLGKIQMLGLHQLLQAAMVGLV
jgi:hypothetical protein